MSAEKYTIEKIVEHVFTTENPDTGHNPNPYLAWVIFDNGTVFLTSENDDIKASATWDELKDYAWDELDELGIPKAGTSSADFSVKKLSWYPEDFIYLVSYDHPNIFNIMIMDEEKNDVSVGLHARSIRHEDVEKHLVRTVRCFDGKTYDMKDMMEALLKPCHGLSAKYAPPKMTVRDAAILDYHGDDSFCTHLVDHKKPEDVTTKDLLKYGMDWAFMDGQSLLFYFYGMVKNILEETDIETEFYFYSLDRKIGELEKSISIEDLKTLSETLWKISKEWFHWCYDERSTPHLFDLITRYNGERE